MLKIRLQRVGRKNIPTFRVVLTDSRNSSKSGRYLEVLGVYDPVNDVKEVKAERINYWIKNGAQASGTVHNFLVSRKIIAGKKVNVLPSVSIKPEKKDTEAVPTAVPAAGTAEEASKKESK